MDMEMEMEMEMERGEGREKAESGRDHLLMCGCVVCGKSYTVPFYPQKKHDTGCVAISRGWGYTIYMS